MDSSHRQAASRKSSSRIVCQPISCAGKKAARLTPRPGDQIDMEKGTILERTELQRMPQEWIREDSNNVYSFSLFLPKNFPVVPTRFVIAQWKQRCPGNKCDPDNPVLAVRYVAHELLGACPRIRMCRVPSAAWADARRRDAVVHFPAPGG